VYERTVSHAWLPDLRFWTLKPTFSDSSCVLHSSSTSSPRYFACESDERGGERAPRETRSASLRDLGDRARRARARANLQAETRQLRRRRFGERHETLLLLEGVALLPLPHRTHRLGGHHRVLVDLVHQPRRVRDTVLVEHVAALRARDLLGLFDELGLVVVERVVGRGRDLDLVRHAPAHAAAAVNRRLPDGGPDAEARDARQRAQREGQHESTHVQR
jgi:hypothetical protein